MSGSSVSFCEISHTSQVQKPPARSVCRVIVMMASLRFDTSSLVLLCHKRRVQQNGQHVSCLSKNLASLMRSVAIEYGLCRSARMR